MALSDLTSRDAVLAAIKEFDDLGRETFLKKHGFGPARQFFIEHGSQRYDSKAIAGLLTAISFPIAVRSSLMSFRAAKKL